MTASTGDWVELWVEPRDGGLAVNPVIRRLLDGLGTDGVRMTVRAPEHASVGPWDPTHRVPDLVLLKTATSFGLSMAIAAERHGVRFYNDALASWRASDKALTIGRLAAARLPVPQTWVAGEPPAGPPAGLDPTGDWVAKPVFGVHGRGVEVHAGFPAGEAVATEADQRGVAPTVDDGTRLIQRRIGGSEDDVKVYVAGGHVFAGRKRFGSESYTSDAIAPVGLGEAARAVVLAAGATLGLRCFGVDLRFEGDRPVIIDVNPFPGFRGFPAAADALREEIVETLSGARR